MFFTKFLSITFAFSRWAERALADGVIDQNEMVDLVKNLLESSGIKAEIKLD